MTKDELIAKSKNLDLGEYIIVLDKISDEPLVMGCSTEGGVWKVYKTKERGGHYIIKEFDKESDAFDYFYELVLVQHKRTLQN